MPPKNFLQQNNHIHPSRYYSVTELLYDIYYIITCLGGTQLFAEDDQEVQVLPRLEEVRGQDW